jgi:hypothetical protein
MPCRPEDAAGAKRVPDALVHAVFQGDLVIHLEGIHAAHLDHHHHIVGIFQRFAAIRGFGDGGVDAAVLDHPVHKRMHFVEPGVG